MILPNTTPIAAKLHWFDFETGPMGETKTPRRLAGGIALRQRTAPADWTPWSAALDNTAVPFYRWFVDGQTNACFNLLTAMSSGRGETGRCFRRRPLGPFQE